MAVSCIYFIFYIHCGFEILKKTFQRVFVKYVLTIQKLNKLILAELKIALSEIGRYTFVYLYILIL